MRAVRIAGWALLAVVVLLAAGLGVFVATFDTQAAVARLAAQVHRATGRDLAVAGPVRVLFSWPPELVVDGVSLSNLPGGSRPAMVTVPEIRARLALRPLLSGRAELDLMLVRPDVLLENGNWVFTPEALPPAAPGGPSRAPLVQTSLRRVVVQDGHVAVRRPATDIAVAVPSATATLGDGETTATARLTWVAGAANGTADVAASAGAHGTPIHIRADLSGGTDAVRLSSIELDAPAMDVPAHFKAALAVRGLPVAADLAVRPDQVGSGKPLQFTLALAAAGAALTAQGSVAEPASLRGTDVAVSARIPELAALTPLAGSTLPAVGAVSFDGRVLDRDGFRSGMALRSLRLSAAPGDLSGDVALGWSGRPSLRGTLSSSRLDADALAVALPRQPAAPVPPPPALPGPAAPAAPSSPAVSRAGSGHVIPDWPLPVQALGSVDVDLQLSVASLVVRQVSGAVDGHVAASDGRVRLDPLAVTLPGGRVAGSMSADTGATPAAWAVVMRSTGFRLDGVTDAVHGTADMDVDLTATGATTGALAGTVDGRANLSVTRGDIDNRLLAPLLDAALRAAHVGMDLGGRTSLRCLVLPLTASHGTVSASGLLLDAGRLSVEGEGTAELGAETLALQLRPVLRVGAAGVSAPVRVSGTFAHPQAVLAAADGRVGFTVGTSAPQPEACGPAPSPAGPSGTAADLLRRLLR